MVDYWITQGDRPPTSVEIGLRDSRGQAVNLTGATAVRFRARAATTGVLVLEQDCEVVNPPAEGKIRIDWEAGSWQVSGDYWGEIEVEWPGGRRLSFPTYPKMLIRVVPQIG